MNRRARSRLALVRWVWVGFLVLVLNACGFMVEQEEAMPNEAILTDLATLVPPGSPNNWLIAPAAFGSATPDEVAPTLDVPAQRLAEIWIEMIREQPRTRILGVSQDELQIEAEQRSAVFGFTDRISVRVLPVDAGRSTFVAYSRAQVGFWDLGVNRSRLRKWLSMLQARAS